MGLENLKALENVISMHDADADHSLAFLLQEIGLCREAYVSAGRFLMDEGDDRSLTSPIARPPLDVDAFERRLADAKQHLQRLHQAATAAAGMAKNSRVRSHLLTTITNIRGRLRPVSDAKPEVRAAIEAARNRTMRTSTGGTSYRGENSSSTSSTM